MKAAPRAKVLWKEFHVTEMLSSSKSDITKKRKQNKKKKKEKTTNTKIYIYCFPYRTDLEFSAETK